MLDFRKLRESKGFTQEQLAEKLGISRQAISKIELGISKPNVQNAKKLGELLGVNWTGFYDDKVHS